MDEIFERVWERKIAFLATFFLVFTLSYILLLAVDFLPEEPAAAVINSKSEDETSLSATENDLVSNLDNQISPVPESDEFTDIGIDSVDEPESVESFVSVLPVSINIIKLDKKIMVNNPTSRSVPDLDASLMTGVVRHPDSATLGQDGSVFILGHSSYLPKVFNKNFQAFNGIQNLEWGDSIEVYSEDMLFTYRVEKVYRANATDLTVPIAGNEKRLTLATCNSFGSVDDRYIVEARQIDVQHL